jgi:hypothetical protein
MHVIGTVESVHPSGDGRPAKDNSKKTSDGFKDLLKEKCQWHLEGNHTTEKCYQLRRALKDSPDPRPPHDKKGKKKAEKATATSKNPTRRRTSSSADYPPNGLRRPLDVKS